LAVRAHAFNVQPVTGDAEPGSLFQCFDLSLKQAPGHHFHRAALQAHDVMMVPGSTRPTRGVARDPVAKVNSDEQSNLGQFLGNPIHSGESQRAHSLPQMAANVFNRASVA